MPHAELNRPGLSETGRKASPLAEWLGSQSFRLTLAHDDSMYFCVTDRRKLNAARRYLPCKILFITDRCLMSISCGTDNSRLLAHSAWTFRALISSKLIAAVEEILVRDKLCQAPHAL